MQENEELRQLVRLIQEKQELKLLLRDRARGRGFRSSGLLAEWLSAPGCSGAEPSSSRMLEDVSSTHPRGLF